jgi:hypothetical protein
MTRFLFLGYTLAYSPRFQQSDWYRDIQFYPFVCIQPDGRSEESNLASAEMVFLWERCDSGCQVNSSSAFNNVSWGGKIKDGPPFGLPILRGLAPSSAKHPLVRAFPPHDASGVEASSQNLDFQSVTPPFLHCDCRTCQSRHLYISC